MKRSQQSPSFNESLKVKPFLCKPPQPQVGLSRLLFDLQTRWRKSRRLVPAEVENARRLIRRQGRILLLVTLVVMACISMASLAFRFYTLDQAETKVASLERTLDALKAAMNVDSVRQYQIQKIMAIIDRYNPAMPSEKKYEIADEIYKMTIKYPNLNVDLICATITHESALSWRPEVKSQAGAMGLMQIMPTTAFFLAADENIQWTKSEEILYNPILNIRLGCRYLSTLISLYDLDGGLAAYNGGEKRAALWLASGRDDKILWEETRGYVPAVLKLYQEFQN